MDATVHAAAPIRGSDVAISCSLPRAFVDLEALSSRSDVLVDPSRRAAALVHVVAAARAIEHAALLNPSSFGTLAGDQHAKLCLLTSAIEHEDARAGAELLFAHLERRLASSIPEPYELATIARRAVELFGPRQSLPFQRFVVELAAGDIEAARSRAHALSKRTLRRRALDLSSHGVVTESERGQPFVPDRASLRLPRVRHSRRELVLFTGDLDLLAALRPSLPLIRELLRLGPHARRLAEMKMRELCGADREEALALFAMTALDEEGAAAVIANLRAVRYANVRVLGWRWATTRAIAARRDADVDHLLAHAPSPRACAWAEGELARARLGDGPRPSSVRPVDESVAIALAARGLIESVARIARISHVQEPLGALTAETAHVLGALSAEAVWDRARRDSRFRAQLHPVRAHFDEAVARSSFGRRHRTALLDASRGALMRALERGGDLDLDELEAARARLRTLRALGGERSARIVERLAEHVAELHVELRPAVLELFAELATVRAARLFVTHHRVLVELGLIVLFAEAIEKAGLFPRGLGAAWWKLLAGFEGPTTFDGDRRAIARAAAWSAAFVARYVEVTRSLPSFEAIDLTADVELGPDGAAWVDAMMAERDRLAALAPDDLVARLARDDRARQVLAFGNGVLASRRHPARDPSWWHAAIERLPRDVGLVDLRPLRSLQSWLPLPRAVEARLILGAAPFPALERPIPLGEGDLELRLLDKRRDLTAFLRFADCTNNCLSSASSGYGGREDKQRWVLTLWRDPLSFVFQIVHAPKNGVAEARGFVFGGFAIVDHHPAIIANGIYLRRQQPHVRARILEVIEHELVRPLRVRTFGLAAINGGFGAVPREWEEKDDREILRLRALRQPSGRLVVRTYDDVSTRVNEVIRMTDRVFWKTISPKFESPGGLLCSSKRPGLSARASEVSDA